MSFTELRHLYRDFYHMNLGMTAVAIRHEGFYRELRESDFIHAKKWARTMAQFHLDHAKKVSA